MEYEGLQCQVQVLELTHVTVKSRVRLFADDTAMYLALSSYTEGQVLQNDLLSLEKWEKMWDMNFNPSKCQVLHVTRLKTPIETKYFLHDTMLDSVSSAKYLGVTISDDLSWSTHIDNITKSANQTLGFLKRNMRVHYVIGFLTFGYDSILLFCNPIALALPVLNIGL